MTSKFKCVLIGAAFLILAMLVVMIRLNVTKEASVAFVSQSGKYRIEAVKVIFPYIYDHYFYFRVIELANPSLTYRSPIVRDGIDLHSFESALQVGIVWLDFNKVTHQFDLSYPEWSESWLNLFISNTPYTVLPNG
jgi:hypothetical protein